jgi:protocatechuate 3,4-dioxygenase, alpha subunit
MQTTPSQTVGPFFAYGLTAKQYGYDYSSLFDDSLVDDSVQGKRINIIGQIFDGQGNRINDAMVELFQEIEINNVKTIKMARQGTGPDTENRFNFITIKPKGIVGEAPHINAIITMRGSLRHLYTRLYFSDETESNNQDNLLNSVAIERRNTLIANKFIKNEQEFYEFNINMQGENETVFFDL